MGSELRSPLRAAPDNQVHDMTAQALVIRAGVGFLYPAYKSLHAIMNDDREASITWMRYWVVLAVFSIIETVVDPLLDFLPGYLLGKCLFLVWCMAPSQHSGSNLVFTQVIFPTFKKHHESTNRLELCTIPSWKNLGNFYTTNPRNGRLQSVM